MEWIKVLTIAGSTIGASWIMHRRNVKARTERSSEMKDFHQRLYAIQERHLEMTQRILEKKE